MGIRIARGKNHVDSSMGIYRTEMEKRMSEKQSIFSKIAYSCFYVGVIIEVLMVLVDKSAYTNPIEGRLFQMTFLLFLIKVCLTRYTLKEYVIIFLFCVLGAVSYFVTGRNEVIRLVMFAVACKNVDMKRCLKLVFYLTLSGCILIMLLSVTGIYGAVSLTQDYGRGSVETRYTLGMGHPNALHCMFLMLLILLIYLYAEKMKLYHFILLILFNGGMYFLTLSRTGAMVSAFAIFCAIILKYSKKIQRGNLIYILLEIEMLLCVGIAYWSAKYSYIILYYPQLKSFDRLLSGRIGNLYNGSLSHAGALQTWTWWGVPENKYYFDMGWVRIFYWYGIIPALIYISMLGLLIWQLKKKKACWEVIILAALFVYTLIEAHIVSVYMARDYTLFILGSYWATMLEGKNAEEKYFWQMFGLKQKRRDDL